MYQDAALPPSHPVAAPAQPRACGRAELSVRRRDARSVIGTLHQGGSLRLLFPRTPGPALTAVVLNTAGGITGGDRFRLRADAAEGADLVLTTQAAERAYRAAGTEPGRVETRLSAEPGARLHWLPQETILYDGFRLDRRLRVDLAPGAAALIVEPLIFGRAAMGETLRAGSLRDRIDILRGGERLFADRTRLEGDIARRLAGPATGQGAGAAALVVYAAPDAAGHLRPARELARGAASLPAEDCLVARLLAPDGFALRARLLPLIAQLSTVPLPRPWTI